MGSNKLLLQAIRREQVARRPLWIMRQAGRYLPEYREFRRKHSFKELAGAPDLAAEVTLMPLKRFPLDAAIVFADIMSPLPALGIEFDFDPGPVVAAPIRDAKGIERLRDPAPEEIAPEVIETLKLTRAALPEDTALLGFCGAPWTLAAYLVEGRGVKVGIDTHGARFDPDTAERTLDRESLLNEAVKLFKKAEVDSIVVVDGTRPVGVLDVQDLIKLGLLGQEHL